MMNATTDNQVTIKKTISTTTEGITFNYLISSPAATVGRLRLVEQLPVAVASTAVSFGDNDQGQWEYEPPREISFTCERPPPEPIEATFQVRSKTLDPRECVSKLTTQTRSVADESPLSEPLPDGDRSTNGVDTGAERLDTDGGTRRAETTTTHQPTEMNSSGDGIDPATRTELPAVGILSTGAGDDLSRTILQAVQHNLAVFVAVDDEHSTTAQIARKLGATVVETTGSEAIETHKTTVLQAVRDESHPGLIYHTTGGDPVDFDASLSAFEASDEMIIEAVSQSAHTNILVGIPAYNEAETIGAVVESAQDHADEVLVVDDGSSDQTASYAREAGATVIEHGRNRGYGSGLKTIFEEANQRDVDALVVLDGDNQHDVDDIPRLLAKQRDSGSQIVIGNRFGETADTDVPLYRQCGLWVITSLLNVSMGNLRPNTQIRDAQSGFRSYDATAVRSIAEHATRIDDGMSASTDILYHANAQGFAITEVPTTITYDVSNANSHNPVSHGISIINRILTTLEQKRPVTVLGIPGFVIAAVGIGLGYWTVSNYVTSGTLGAEYATLSVVLLLFGTVFVFVSGVQYALNISLDKVGLKEA